jgi:Glycosyl hydrolases family 6
MSSSIIALESSHETPRGRKRDGADQRLDDPADDEDREAVVDRPAPRLADRDLQADEPEGEDDELAGDEGEEDEHRLAVGAGHSAWHPAATMAARLQQAGVDQATGFALNVSNFRTTTAELAYGRELSAQLGGKHFVIDTGRNGLGPNGEEWSKPPGRALGPRPTTATGDPLADAFLWIKQPGLSDGPCNGGPAPGHLVGRLRARSRREVEIALERRSHERHDLLAVHAGQRLHARNVTDGDQADDLRGDQRGSQLVAAQGRRQPSDDLAEDELPQRQRSARVTARAEDDRQQRRAVLVPHGQHPPDQPLAQPVHALGQQRGDHLRGPERQLHGGHEQPVLGLEEVVHHRGVHARIARHVTDPRAVVAVRGEALARGGEDRLARAARAGPAAPGSTTTRTHSLMKYNPVT